MSSPALISGAPSLSSSPSAFERKGRLARPVWKGPEGIRNIFYIALPLIISNLSHSLNMFVDRMFLAWHSKEAFAATLQAGVVHWTLMSLWFATVTYAGTFVAQYTGARRHGRVGPSVWQGVYLALLGGGFMALFYPLAPRFFEWVGHEGILPLLETQYFQILTLGSAIFLIKDGLACFYTGRGKTWIVLLVNALICYLNIVLDSWLIFSPPLGLPGGVQGAALATLLAASLGIVLFALMIFRRKYDIQFHVRRGWRLDLSLLRRLIRFGLPAGFHAFVDMAAFSTFLMVVGKFGFEAQFASNVAMNINILLFIPAIGFAQAGTILAGQFAGAANPSATERMTSGVLLLCMGYMAVTCFLYIVTPDFFIHWFRGNLVGPEWESIRNLSRILLIVVALYSMFDAVSLSISGTLKGAGDTKFVMWLCMIFSQVILTGPCLLLVAWRHTLAPRTGLYLAWTYCSAYILFLSVAFYLRYRAGKWKTMRVIEEEVIEVPPPPPAPPPLTQPAEGAVAP